MEEKTLEELRNAQASMNIEEPKPHKYRKIIILFVLILFTLIFVFSATFYINSLNKKDNVTDNTAPELSPTPEIQQEFVPSPTQKASNQQGGNFTALTADDSMTPLIKSGEEVSVELFFGGQISRGEVVLLRVAENELVVGRIIGLPGEKIKIDKGSIYINGEKITEPYLSTNTLMAAGTFLKEGIETTIPADNYAFFGDNRTKANDSRNLGFVNVIDITGIVKL